MPPQRPAKKKSRTTKNTDPRTQMVRRQIFVGIVLTIAIALLITGIYYVARVESLQIKSVEVIGGTTIPHQQVEDRAREAFTGSYLRLVPKTFRLTFPKSDVISAVRSIDRVKNVDVEIEKQTLIIVYDEFVPIGLWCADMNSRDCLFLDRQGFAFGLAPALEGSAFVRFIDQAVKPEKYADAFTPEFISANQTLVEDLETELGLYVTHIEKIGDYDIEYTVAGGGIIKTSQVVETEASFKNLRTILQSPEFAHLGPGEFKYIDLRFGDKVFVNEEIDSLETGTSSTPETQ